MTLAITGATGQLGRLVLDRLTALGHPATGLARRPGPDQRLFDYDRPDTLAPALAGIDSLLLISGSEIGRRVAQHRAVIDAAVAAGVRRITYTSLLRADRSILSLAEEHRQTEAMLAASGLTVTILRNGWYHENYLAGIPAALQHGVLMGSAGQGRIASAARADYAEAAVAVLLGPGHDSQTYELAGAPTWTLADLAAQISQQTGRDIPYRDLPEADYAAVLAGAMPAPLAQVYAGLDAAAAQGALDGDGAVLARLIGRPSQPLAEAVRAALA
ncbi:SDR family oxidoreductase [Paracoccus hibiscisoli]|uniref:SDR family oxidoreductase n=1 Tax=Paracoccus hibiscisoli TaxID=2023261 RepID=A0A4U0QPE0_9RHOB|nr:SDR family oxidoreductase [Paracoccus hibiscisoli]TJZ83773.1 SDR family oxidoreductase [Paracoccus hibiscisoli]